VLVLLIGAALALQPADDAIRAAFAAALVLGLLGDVLLMLDRFIPGAAAFLAGHVAYAFGLVHAEAHRGWFVVGAALGLAGALSVGRRIVAATVPRSRTLAVIVGAYIAALGAVVALAFGSAVPAAAGGALLFAVSDSLLSWGRFVGPAPGGRTAVHVTYHIAQALLVVSLLDLQPGT
jgi:uncharacterized membrane protein YhhN